MRTKLLHILFLSIFAVTGLSACGTDSMKPDEKTTYPKDPDDRRREKHGKLTGEEGIWFGARAREKRSTNTGVGVNSYLWRATLDTINFMPLAQVDPHGGVIITDWYENPEAKGEQFKLNVLILGTELRADGVRVSVFRRVGGKDVKANPEVGKDLEDKILTRARELRINGATDDE